MKLTCPECLEEFASKNELDNHKKTCKKQEVYKATPPVPKQEPKKLEKPKLTYLYKGVCTSCAGQLSTLEIEVEKKHFCIAFCNRCNKQIESREVVKL